MHNTGKVSTGAREEASLEMSRDEKLDLIIRQNRMIFACLKLNLAMEIKMADTLDDVVGDITNLTTVEEGTAATVDLAIALLDEISAKLKDAGIDPVKLAAIRASIAQNSTQLAEKKDALSAAVVRNTPLDPSGN